MLDLRFTPARISVGSGRIKFTILTCPEGHCLTRIHCLVEPGLTAPAGHWEGEPKSPAHTNLGG